MLHRGIKFVHAVVLAFSAVLAFLVVSDLDEGLFLGNRAALLVDGANDSVSGREVVRELSEFATEHGAVIGRELPDLEDSEGRRHLYLAAGDPNAAEASWLKDGYPDFGRQLVTEVHPLQDVGDRDPRGIYYVFGDRPSEREVVEKFESLGLQISLNRPLSFSELRNSYADSPLFESFLITALALVTLTGASVLLSARTYGVLRLQGMSFTRAYLRDLSQLGRFWLITAALVAAAVTTVLGLYNGLARLGLYAAVALGLAVVLEILVLAAHAAVLRLTWKTRLAAALKGEIPARASSIAAYAVRLPALLLIVGLAAQVAAAGQDLLERRQVWETYVAAGDATGIRITGSVGIDEIPEMEKAVGSRLHQADRDGQLIVAGRQWLRDLFRQELPGELLIVNESFLAAQPVLTADGKRYAPPSRPPKSDGRVQLLVPESLGAQAEMFKNETPRILSPEDPKKIAPGDIESHPIRSGQRIFSYTPGDSTDRAGGAGTDRSFVRDPVLLVIPDGSRYLSDINYYAFATRNQVIFPDPKDVHRILAEDPKMKTYIAALFPVKQKAATAMREASAAFRLQLFELAAGSAVLLITAVGVCIVHARRNAQAIFVRHISGWTFGATHRALLAVEAAIAVALCAWLPLRTWWDNQDLAVYAARGIPSPRPPAEVTGLDVGAAAGLAGLTLAVVLTALFLFHRRIVREGTSEA
ncbi:hypothetical protein ACGFMM_12215 [Streptomyces sp. NPDC048604]|uniref:hypothetical protein n=1 Tax=Streptomyces sp. NPDC048604 TaxID=3365578 RepID=UPI00371F1EDC